MTDHIECLSQYPNIFDRDLDLDSEYKPDEDKWIEKIKYFIKDEQNQFGKIREVLEQGISIEQAVKSRFKKALTCFNKIICKTTELGVPLKSAKIKDFAIIYKGGKGGKLRNPVIKFSMLENTSNFENTSLYLPNRKPYRGKAKAFVQASKKTGHIVFDRIENRTLKDLKRNKYIIVEQGLSNKYQNYIETLYHSHILTGILMGLQLKIFVEESIRIYNNGNVTFDGISKITQNLAQIGDGIFYIKNSQNILRSSKPSDSLVVFGKIANRTNAIITLAIAIGDTIKHYRLGDNDTALAYGVASLCAGTLTLATFGVITLTFWPAAILTGAIVACYILAEYLKDSELESYFKYCIFGSKSNFDGPKYKELPYKYNNSLIEKSISLKNSVLKNSDNDEPYSYLYDIEESYTKLIDLFNPIYFKVKVKIEPSYLLSYHKYLNHSFAIGHSRFFNTADKYKYYVPKKFRVLFFHDNIIEISNEVLYFPKGVNGGVKPVKFYSVNYGGSNNDFSDEDTCAYIEFNMPENDGIYDTVKGHYPNSFPFDLEEFQNKRDYKYKYWQAEFVVLVSLKPSDGVNPIDLKDESRYKYIVIPAKIDFENVTNKNSIPKTDTNFFVDIPLNKGIKPKGIDSEKIAYKNSIYKKLNDLKIETYEP